MNTKSGRTSRRVSLAVSASVVALGVLSGCGSSDSSSSATNPGGTQSASASKGTIALVLPMRGIDFYTQVTCGLQAEATKLGYKVTSSQAPEKWDASLQIPTLNAAVATKPNAIVTVPTEPNALVPPIKEANQQGIKFVTVDQPLKDESLYASFIASDNVAGGATAAKAMNDLLSDGGKVMVMTNTPTGTSLEREQGFAEGVKKYPGLDYLGAKANPDNSAAQAAGTMSAMLQRYPDLKGVFAVNDLMAQGAATALQEASKTGQVKVIQFDSTSAGADLMRKGKLDALIAQLPRQMGVDAAEQVDAALTGKPTTKHIATPFTVITQSNISDPKFAKLVYGKSC